MHTLSFCNQTVQTFTRTQKKNCSKAAVQKQTEKKKIYMREIKKKKKKERK